MKTQKDVKSLYNLSGFPEPFLKGSKANANRWSRFYRQRIAGGTLSINSLAEDVQVSNKTLGKWVDALERLYALFRLSPFGLPEIKAIKKTPESIFL